MYRVMNLGQDATQAQPSPAADTRRDPDPGICCQAVPDGSVVCSDGIIYMPGCPKAPKPNVAGNAEVVNGIPVPPSTTACQAQTGGPIPAPSAPATPSVWTSLILPMAGAAIGGAGLAAGAYFLFLKK